VIGQVFENRYEILRKLGAGGMAEVYLAHDRHLGRDVALKVLHANYAQDEQFIERFRREASNAASLNHPNIVQIYDRGEAEGTYFIAMEYLDGRSLKDIISKYAPLRPEHVISIASQILEALRFAHRKDIIHRDIKPQNIIVDDEGRVKVTDFGIARAGGAARMTETGSILGTAHYFSPEQAMGGRVEAASDLYSLGIVMYEMTTGRLPFDGDNPVAIAMQHVNDPPPPPSQWAPGTPENLEHVIMRALVKSPAQRYLTADAFLDDLRKVQAGQPVAAPPSLLADEVTRVTTPVVAVAAADRTTIRPGGPRPAGMGDPAAVVPAPPIKRSSVWPWVLVLLFVVALGVGLYLLLSSAGGSASAQVDVPDLSGKTQQQAQQAMDDLGLKLTVAGTKPSVDVGKVVEQNPVSGARAAKGSTVQVWLGASDGKIPVPDLTGKNVSQAGTALGQAKLILAAPISEPSNSPKDTITRQNPAAGTPVVPGTTVTVWVSAGPAGGQVDVPNIVGKTQDAALVQLTALKLAGNPQAVDSNSPAGQVVSQSPKPGQLVVEGSTVTFQVSNGPKPTTTAVPPVIGLTEAQAKSAIVLAGLVATVATASGDAPAGTVMDQTPVAGATVNKGSTVHVVVSTGPPPTTTTTELPTTTTT
jgi:beta-lactam-binding protein with PASTA domain/predicted Ser/Thr protein kinase